LAALTKTTENHQLPYSFLIHQTTREGKGCALYGGFLKPVSVKYITVIIINLNIIVTCEPGCDNTPGCLVSAFGCCHKH